MMKIIVKQSEGITAGSLDYGDTFQSASGRIFMVVNGLEYLKEDGSATAFQVVVVDLERGLLDRVSKSAPVRPIKLVAREE